MAPFPPPSRSARASSHGAYGGGLDWMRRGWRGKLMASVTIAATVASTVGPAAGAVASAGRAHAHETPLRTPTIDFPRFGAPARSAAAVRPGAVASRSAAWTGDGGPAPRTRARVPGRAHATHRAVAASWRASPTSGLTGQGWLVEALVGSAAAPDGAFVAPVASRGDEGASFAARGRHGLIRAALTASAAGSTSGDPGVSGATQSSGGEEAALPVAGETPAADRGDAVIADVLTRAAVADRALADIRAVAAEPDAIPASPPPAGDAPQAVVVTAPVDASSAADAVASSTSGTEGPDRAPSPSGAGTPSAGDPAPADGASAAVPPAVATAAGPATVAPADTSGSPAAEPGGTASATEPPASPPVVEPASAAGASVSAATAVAAAAATPSSGASEPAGAAAVTAPAATPVTPAAGPAPAVAAAGGATTPAGPPADAAPASVGPAPAGVPAIATPDAVPAAAAAAPAAGPAPAAATPAAGPASATATSASSAVADPVAAPQLGPVTGGEPPAPVAPLAASAAATPAPAAATATATAAVVLAQDPAAPGLGAAAVAAPAPPAEAPATTPAVAPVITVALPVAPPVTQRLLAVAVQTLDASVAADGIAAQPAPAPAPPPAPADGVAPSPDPALTGLDLPAGVAALPAMSLDIASGLPDAPTGPNPAAALPVATVSPRLVGADTDETEADEPPVAGSGPEPDPASVGMGSLRFGGGVPTAMEHVAGVDGLTSGLPAGGACTAGAVAPGAGPYAGPETFAALFSADTPSAAGTLPALRAAAASATAFAVVIPDAARGPPHPGAMVSSSVIGARVTFGEAAPTSTPGLLPADASISAAAAAPGPSAARHLCAITAVRGRPCGPFALEAADLAPGAHFITLTAGGSSAAGTPATSRSPAWSRAAPCPPASDGSRTSTWRQGGPGPEGRTRWG